MKVHHLNCATLCPLLARKWLSPAGTMVCHCLLVETSDGLVLIDTGFGMLDVARPERSTDAAFRFLTGLRLQAHETALHQIKALGFRPEDVRHILPTHLDLDHAGGLGDFPHAQVHILATELQAAQARAHLLEQQRYRPGQWSHAVRWVRHEAGAGQPWFGFSCVRDLPGLPPEILIVPLHGHTRGHAGIAVRRDDQWLLHCGDAYFFAGEVDPDRPHAPAILTRFQQAMSLDEAARVRNQARLRALRREHPAEVAVFCAHDTTEFDRLRQPPATGHP